MERSSPICTFYDREQRVFLPTVGHPNNWSQCEFSEFHTTRHIERRLQVNGTEIPPLPSYPAATSNLSLALLDV